ncbi:hypothetical protein K227x_63720 [Rubripirellula lacrimiformis]|uniref:DUF7932 domain-containing protein n=1 Tax=Rubripirellula lacrimiformis TaxID=1930273 RepID=A0A517NLJ7_9BACT|nr:hypothetical protein [Rubripirellula lacrimiformis]QDT07943.1 hypothetical protein K227x_63720 [Rubripirellula lacrimiformis]
MASPPDPYDFQRHLSDAGCFASDGETELIGRIDISGHDGAYGTDGQNRHNAPPTEGTRGYRGGDATPAAAGQDAGSVQLNLSYGSDRNAMIVSGSSRSPNHGSQPIQQLATIGTEGYFFVRAAGGAGGNGGRGGDGGPGSRGYRGRNATRFSSGTNGGPGGDGGDAGNPTDGKPGGDGGDAVIAVHENDQGLLMLVKGNLAAGDMGFAGEPGRGGHGGPGGPGGSSYHWTERRSYRDSQGRTQTRTIMRSNPGGVSGPSGRDGRTSGYRARDGWPGSVGTFKIVVVDDQGRQRTYDSPYDLELVTFDVASEYTILEPDSLVSIDNLTVRNCGGMPTPPNYMVRIYLDSDQWLHCDGVDLVISHSIAPEQTHTFDTRGLRLRLGDYVVDEPRKRAFRLRHPVSPQASLESGIGRSFRQFENGEDLNIRFPIELMSITCLNSLAPGESTRVIWGVTNIGDEPFDQKYLYRAVRSHARLLGGDLDPGQIVFFDDTNQPYDLVSSAFEKRVGELPPGETTIIETRIGIRESADAIPYQGFALGVDLDLQRPKSSQTHDQYRCVDYRKTFIRVSERYLREPGSRFLLIANEKTTTTDIDQWTQLADYFGSSLDVWDVSYYGFLDLIRAVDHDKSLLQQWTGMTIIIPNNYYQTPDGSTVAFNQLAKSQFLRAAADHDINFYIVGDSRIGGEQMLSMSLIPVSDEKKPSQLKSQQDFLQAVRRWNQYVARSHEVVGGITSNAQDLADVSLGAVHQFDINRRTMLFQPKAEWLEAEAKRLQRKLSKDDPLHRWIIVHRYDTGDTDTEWGFFKQRQIGKIEVRRTLDATKGSAVLYEVDGIDAIDRDFITSKANKHGIFLALKFEDKVDRFIRLVSERTFPRYSEHYVDRPLSDEEVRQIGGELVDSILTDLFNEQRVARTCKTWGPFGVRTIMPKLNYLAERSLNYGVTYRQMLENDVSLGLLYELVANVRYMAVKSKTVWDHALIPTSFFKRSRAVSNFMLDRSDRIVTNIFGRYPGWWDRITGAGDDYDPFGSSRVKEPQGIARKTADDRIHAIETELYAAQVGIEKYATAQDHPGLTYDPELLGEQVRVMTGKQYDQLVLAEARASRQRYETEKAVQAERSDLLVPLSTPQAIESQIQVSLPTP